MSGFLNFLARRAAGMSLPAAYRLGNALGWFVGRVVRPRRKYILRTLAERMPETTPAERARIADGMYRGLALNTLETFRVAGGRLDETLTGVSIEGEDQIREALANGHGVLLLVAHIGNWDLMGMAAPRFGYPLTFLSKRVKNKGLNESWMKLRRETGVRILPPKNSYRDCLRVLKKNELLGFMLDINRPGPEAIFVDFFGCPAATTPGLAFLSAHSGAPVLPVFIHRSGVGRHRIQIHPAIPPPAKRDADSILEATQLYTRAIEDEVRRKPEDWLWMHKRWRTQPSPSGPDSTPQETQP